MPVRRSTFPTLLLVLLVLLVVVNCGKDEPTRPRATDPPTIAAVTPGAWSVVTGIVDVTVEAPGAEKVTLQVNGQTLVRSSLPFRFVWDTRGFPNGSRQLRLVATNGLGTADSTVTIISNNPEWGVAVVAPVREVHLGPGGSVSLSAIVVGTTDTRVSWSVDGDTSPSGLRGSVDAQGLYTAPRHVPDPPVVRLIARSTADPSQFTYVLVYLEGISVQIDPETAGLPVTRSARLVARVSGIDDRSVTWRVDDEPAHGMVTADGLFTAPAVLPDPPVATVRAISVADPTKSATATLQLTGPVTVVVSPVEAGLLVGQTLQLTGSAQGAPDPGVEWSVERRPGLDSGRVTADGLYTAPGYASTPPVVHVWARSHFDTLSRAVVTITLREPPPPVRVTVTPSAAQVATGSSRQFTATVEYTDNHAVVWSLAGAGSISPSGLYTAPAVVPANAAVVINAASVADPARGGSARVTIVSAVDVATRELLDTLSRSGYRSAMISDQAVQIVASGLARASQLNGGQITTTGVVRRVDGGAFVYEPPPPGDHRLSFIGNGPRVDLTVDSLAADGVTYAFGSRLSGSNFVGYLDCRLQIDGVADLEIETSGVEGTPGEEIDFDRTVVGQVVAQGRNWQLAIRHSGRFGESFHFGRSEHHVAGRVTVGGVLLTLNEQIDVWFVENCYTSGGGFYVGRSWQMANRADTGVTLWRIESDYRDNVDSNCGFYDRVQYPESWFASGALAIDATLAGPVEFDGSVVAGTVPPPFVIRFHDRAPLAITLPRFSEVMIVNPLLY